MDNEAAAECAEAVLGDLNDRAGFDAWWESIDRETRKDIRDTLAEIIKRMASGKETSK